MMRILGFLALVPAPALAQSCRLLEIGNLGGAAGTTANDLSDDGRTIVGGSQIPSGQYHAFRWTFAGGIQDIDLPDSAHSFANGVSADGSVIVGRMLRAGVRSAFRWTAAGGMENLGSLGGNNTEAYAVSDDGSVVVGFANTAANAPRYFRWTRETGMVDTGLAFAPALNSLEAMDATGTVLVGYRAERSEQTYAYRYSSQSGITNIGSLTGGWGAAAVAISADAQLVVGVSPTTPSGAVVGFVWTASSGMLPLPALSPNRGSAAAVLTSDGLWAGGTSGVTSGADHLVRWNTQSRTPQDLGVAPTFAHVVGISASGRVLAMSHIVNSQAHSYRWTIAADFDNNAFVDFFDYSAFTDAFESGDPAADFNEDGFLDFFDYDGFVVAFESGC